MGGVSVPPQFPPTEGAGPPPPDLVQEGKLQAQGKIEAGESTDWLTSVAAGLAKAFVYVMRGMSQALNKIVALVMQGFTAGQGMQNPEFDDAVAAVLTDLMGVEFSSDLMKRARARGGAVTEMREIGATFLQQLLGEFGTGIDLRTEPNAAPALTFVGFLMSFAVRQGNIAFLSELLSLRYGEQFRAYGENMANNLSFGRLARLALRPVIDDAVAKPLQDVLRRNLRPTDLNVLEAVRAFNRGRIDEVQFKDTMTKLGYADDLQDLLRELNLLSPNADEIFTLLRWGRIDQDTADLLLKRAGFNPDFVPFLQDARNVQRADAAISDYLSALRAQVRDRRVDSDTFRTLVENLPISEEQRRWELRIAGQELEVPARRLTLAQMRNYFFEGLIALEDFAAWTEAEGYSPDNQRLLILDLLHDSKFEEDKILAGELTLKLRELTLAKKAAKAGVPLKQFQGL